MLTTNLESEFIALMLHIPNFSNSTSAASLPHWRPTTPPRTPTAAAAFTPSSATTAWPSRPPPAPFLHGFPLEVPSMTSNLPTQTANEIPHTAF